MANRLKLIVKEYFLLTFCLVRIPCLPKKILKTTTFVELNLGHEKQIKCVFPTYLDCRGWWRSFLLIFVQNLWNWRKCPTILRWTFILWKWTKLIAKNQLILTQSIRMCRWNLILSICVVHKSSFIVLLYVCLLCISTSKGVLRTPFAGQNNFFRC